MDYKMTQWERIEKHLSLFGSITTLESAKYYGITRLSAVILILRKKQGYDIMMERVPVYDKEGYKSNIGRYSFI